MLWAAEWLAYGALEERGNPSAPVIVKENGSSVAGVAGSRGGRPIIQ